MGADVTLTNKPHSSLWVDSFTESSAGALNLNVSSQQATSLQTGVGGKIALPMKRDSVIVVPQVYATYQHEYSDNSRGLDARLSQAGSTFPSRPMLRIVILRYWGPP